VNANVSPWAWGFLLASAALLLAAMLLGSLDLGWLAPDRLNPLALRQLPEFWRVDDLWSDVVLPVSVALLIALTVPRLPRRRWSYGLVTALLLLFALRYFAWRTTTVNTAHPLSLTASVLLLATESLYLVTTGLQAIPGTTFFPERRRRQADQLRPWSEAHQPSVDIWIPTYNEPARLIRRAILTCRNLRYRRFTITVLDDGHRSEIAALAAELGVQYLSRPDNSHRKAGNLNHALAHTQGELIAVFDCDFMPLRQFLERTVGFFADPQVALVQTPQHYFQSDFHNRNLGIDLVMPGDLDYFFRYLQVIRDRFNAVICCGTSYVARRSAIESIGGYVTSCLIEDHQTSTKLLTRGWRIVYLDQILSLGEVPRRFADYLDQRLRWLQGNIQIFLRPRELPIWERLDGWQLSFYVNLWISLFTPFYRLVYLLLPLLSLVLGFTLIAAPPVEYAAYGFPFLLLLYTLPSWLSHYHHFQFWNEVYESLFAFPAAQRTLQILRRPFAIHGGIVTSKEAVADGEVFNLRLAWPFLMLLAVLAMGLLRYLLPAFLPGTGPPGGAGHFEGEALMLGWNVYNGVIALVCLLACLDRPIRRRCDRFPLRHIARLQVGDRIWWGITADLSEEGSLIDLQEVGDQLWEEQPAADGLREGPETAQEGSLSLVEAGLELPARVVRAERSGGSCQVALGFGELGQEQEAQLLELLYTRAAWIHRPRRIGTVDAFLALLESLWRATPLVRR
jgi:cellulose synthase (UDP-forming)